MPDFGLQETGVIRKRLDETIADLEAKMRGIYGENFDLAPDSAGGQLVGLMAGPADEMWELIEEFGTLLDPQQSRGARLDATAQLNGITRGEDQFTTVLVTLTGTPTQVVAAGLIGSTGPDEFRMDAQAVIGTGGTVSAAFTATQPGPIQAAPGTLTTIVGSVFGLDSISNPADPTLVGTLREQDPPFRARREKSAALGAVNITDALVAAVVNVIGVLDVRLLENQSLTTDGLGIPGKSYEVVTDGGADQDIIDAIWANHPLGIASHGAVAGVAVDSQGLDQPINFERPLGKDIWVTVDLTTDAAFPADGDELIKQALVDFAAGTLVGHTSHRLRIGDDVIHSRLFTPINTIPGHTVDDLFIDFSTLPALKADLVLTLEEISRWDIARIVVNT